MEKSAQIFFERLDSCRDALGLSDHGLSVKAGASGDLLRKARANQALPSSTNLARIADVLQVSVEWLLGRSEDKGGALRSDATLADRRLDFRPFENPSNLPVLGTGHCGTVEFGENGEAVSIEQTVFEPTTVVRYITRPPALTGAKEAYAIYFQGDSMEPRFSMGEMAIADPRRPPGIGDDVIVQLFGEDEAHEVTSILVKRLVRRSADGVWLEQFNPPARFHVPASRVARMHRIVPTGELLGG